MSRDVERITANKLTAGHARAGELVERQGKLTRAIAAFFADVEEVKALLKEEGSLWAGPVLNPPIEAAGNALALHGAKETRIEVERLGEAPLMPLTDSKPLYGPPDHG